MARNFDFDKYKAIVDYITASTGLISTSIDQLIKGTIELRSAATAAIIKYSTTIKEISIGTLVGVIGEDKWIATSPIDLDINAETIVVFPSSYEVSEHSMLPTILPEGAIAYIAENFVEKSNMMVEIGREYDAGVITFGQTEVPSITFFKTNYIQKDEAILNGKVLASSSVISDNNNAVSISIGNKLSGAKKTEKIIDVKTDELDTNLFSGVSDKVSFILPVTALGISSGVSISSAPSDISVITSSNIEEVAVKTDLSNLDVVIMQTGVENTDNVLTDQSASAQIVTASGITEASSDIDKTTSPQYTTSRLHPSILPDNNAYHDSENIAEAEAVLTGLKSDVDADRLAVIYGELFGAVPITPSLGVISDESAVIDQLLEFSNGRLGSSLKMVYESVALRLLVDNKELFIDEEEYQNISSIQSTLLKDTDTVDFMRRPMLLEDGAIAVVSAISTKFNDMVTNPSSSQVIGW